MSILITGVNGFLGGHLFSTLQSPENNVTALLRSENSLFPSSAIVLIIDKESNFSAALTNVNIVIHCAARTHVINDVSTNPLEIFREVNTYGTLNLARQAADAGVKRFIFISSIKVNGESTELGNPFTPDDEFIPIDPYGLSKQEAEVGLRKIAQETGMEVVIIRAPLVYGAGVKANFASLMKLVGKGIPLPLGGIKENKRSLVSVDNLVDLITTCISHPKAANQTFLVSDDDDLSTTRMIKELNTALGKKGWLLPIPVIFFEILGKLTGKSAVIDRLCGSLQVDISKTKELLNWQPPVCVKDAFAKTASHFLLNRKKK
jgi:UDP-glucose 4-epimerase